MEPIVEPEVHRKLAVCLYNGIWPLLEKPSRSREEEDYMERSAFASLYHWSKVGDATNIAIGEWMIAHVYVVLGCPDEATRFAERVIEFCQANSLGDFYLAYGYLEMARAMRLADKEAVAQAFAEKARAVPIAEGDDRQLFAKDFAADGW